MKKAKGPIITRPAARYDLASLAVIFICFWVPIIVFCKLAGEIMERQPVALDTRILHFIHGYATSFYDSAFIFITNLGSAEVIGPLTIGVAAYLLYRRYKQAAVILAFGVGGAAVANLVLKTLFHRQRPGLWPWLVSESSYSFPSGHAMISSAVALCAVVLLWRTKYRLLSIFVGVIFVVLVGLSRLYLGVHYPTDIVAGWAVSMAWVLLVSSAVIDFPYKLRTQLKITPYFKSRRP